LLHSGQAFLDPSSHSARFIIMGVPGDFTFYKEGSEFAELCGKLGSQESAPGSEPADASDRYARACTLQFPFTSSSPEADGRAKPQAFVTARALACKSFGARYVSVTCRRLAAGDAPPAKHQGTKWPSRTVCVPSGSTGDQARDHSPGEEGEEGEEKTEKAEKAEKEKLAWIQASTEQLIQGMWEKLPLGDPTRPLTGLIVIAGRTGSGKSEMARAFARRYLERCMDLGGDRRPHLVTYEDPIEKQFADTPDAAALAGFDYTPREKAVDVRNLADATRDALRQTPALFYVGETRDEEDWKTLLRFAGTGHLTITTGHAGSLVETMAQILQAANARTPAERSQVAGRIAALVHIRAHKPKSGTPSNVLVPAFWCRTPRTISAFTAEGLGSMFPHRAAQPGSYGRAHAVERLKYLQEVPELRRKAVEWDLRGE
jgi:hypothetical protein